MKINLWQKVLIGMALGILCGYIFPEHFQLFKPIATIYTNMVKMIVVPTVFFAILFGMTNISDIHSLGRIGIKSTIIYGVATVIAVAIGIAFALFFEPGVGVSLMNGHSQEIGSVASIPQKIGDIITNIIPTNPISAMAAGNTLQVAFFAFLLGLALILIGEKGDDVRKVIISTANVIFKMVELVIKTTPYGVFAIMAWVVGEYGFSLVLSLGKLIFVIMAAFALQYILFGMMLLIAKLKPLQFYKKTFHIQALALATSSSKATITTSIRDLHEKVGVSKRVAGFILPLGATTNMTGSAIYIAACALFFAQAFGITLTGSQYLILILTSTIGSIGAAGYPGGAVIMLSMVLASLGLPIEGIPLILGIDRFVDMFRTAINVTGDCAVTVVVDKMNNTLDIDKYNA
ncbi:MAG: proton/sodium-glutamate symport protein (GltP) [uncultured bacterium]|nr:MAG: proton/sodium-glutamate symport protein (GltP) [uncultured bacterium]